MILWCCKIVRDLEGTRIAVPNMFDCRYVSECRSRGRELVPNFRGDWSWNNFYSHFSSFPLIQEGLLSVRSESKFTKYWLTALSSLPRKSLVWWADHPDMTIAVDWDVKNQTKKVIPCVIRFLTELWCLKIFFPYLQN